MPEEINDPGIGTRFERSTKRIINPDGTYNIQRKGVRRGIRDVFRYLIEISWLKFFLLLFSGYILMNLFFTVLYVIAGVEGIGGIDPNSKLYFLKVFFFSIQTFTTVGYGGMAPVGIAAQSIAAIEAFTGFLSFSLATGLLYGRFSRPTSRLVFSDKILCSKYKEGHSFKLKIANERDSVLLEVEAKMIATFDQLDEDGNLTKKYFRLPLEMSRIEMMPFTWTLVHPLDDESPLQGMKKDDFIGSNIEFLVLVKAYSDVFGTHIHTRHSYTENEIEWNKNFKKIFNANEDGIVEMDVHDINETIDE